MVAKAKVIRGNPRHLQELEKEVLLGVKQAIARGALAVQNTAKQSVQNAPRGGGAFTRYNPKRSGRASAPGEPPATDTGFLVSNISFKIDTDGLGADIESAAEYSAALEFGTMHMEARPFMQPAAEENRDKIKDLVVQTIRKAT